MTLRCSDDAYLEDILSFAQNGMKFVDGMSFEEFSADEKTIYAVIRALEVVGEATKKVSEDFKARHPSIPWRVMAGMRDKLVHDYIGIDLQVVWGAVTKNLPEIVPELRRLLSEMDSGSGI
jgi:uncharacterized protein with HEPN domain